MTWWGLFDAVTWSRSIGASDVGFAPTVGKLTDPLGRCVELKGQ